VEDRKLYTEYYETFEYREEKNVGGIEENEMQVSKKQKILDVIEYIVSVNMNSDDDDEGDTTVRKGWYLVSFKHVAEISMNSTTSNAIVPFVNCINTALKGNMISHCMGFGKSPYMFFFHPPKEQEAILPPFLKEKLYNSIIPLLGLKQSVRYCANSMYGLLLVADFGLRYMYNDINARTKDPFHVLQINQYGKPQSATIANAIEIQNVDDYIPYHLRSEIEKRLQKIYFHIRYYRGGKYENKLRAKQRMQQENLVMKNSEESTDYKQREPLTDEQIEKKKFFLKKNERLFKSTIGEPSIIWEPNTYTFPYVPMAEKGNRLSSRMDYDSALVDVSNPKNEDSTVERQITVEEYFWEQYQYRV
jgi:hypothetical protein